MWSRKYRECVMCGQTNREHKAKGFCARCYQQWRLRDPQKRFWHNRKCRDYIINKRLETCLGYRPKRTKDTVTDGISGLGPKLISLLEEQEGLCAKCKEEAETPTLYQVPGKSLRVVCRCCSIWG